MDKLFTTFINRLSKLRKLKKHINRLALLTAFIMWLKTKKEEKA